MGCRVTVCFGLQGSGQLTDGVPDPGRFRAIAELAEELGFDSLWAGEHLSFHNPILDVGVPHPRTYGTTARVLGRYVRGQRRLPLEMAIAKMTFQTPPPRIATTVSARTINGNDNKISMKRCMTRSTRPPK